MTGSWRGRVSSGRGALRPGVTLIELLISLVVAAIVMGGAVSIFLVFQRSVEQQNVVRATQTEVHSTVEQLIRLVRNADRVEVTSTASELDLSGGLTVPICGGDPCRLSLDEDQGLVVSPVGGTDERVVARSVTRLEFAYAVDADESGVIDCGTGPSDCFVASPGSEADDVLGVRVELTFEAAEARGRFDGDVVFHAALRNRILDRHTLAEPME